MGYDAPALDTRLSGKGSKAFRRETRDQLVDRLSARAPIVEGLLPLPGPIRRVLFKVDQTYGESASRCADVASAVVFQTADQIARAAVVVTSVAAE